VSGRVTDAANFITRLLTELGSLSDTMIDLADLHRAVQSTLASKRLGTLAFVRYSVQSQDKAEAALQRLAQLAAVVRDWLGQTLERIYALGTPKNGHVTITLEFREGATAQLSWTGGAQRGAGVDLMVLGNHGAIYHDAGAANLWDDTLSGLAGKPDQTLLALIDKALQSGQPISAGK
jgi:hypothetical protein